MSALEPPMPHAAIAKLRGRRRDALGNYGRARIAPSPVCPLLCEQSIDPDVRPQLGRRFTVAFRRKRRLQL